MHHRPPIVSTSEQPLSAEERRRFIHISAAGITFQVGSAAVDSSTIRAALVYQLTGSTVAVGATTTILRMGASVLSPFVMAILNVDYGYSSAAKNGLMQREFSDKQRSTMGSMVSLAGSLCFSIISNLLGLLLIFQRRYMQCYLHCQVI